MVNQKSPSRENQKSNSKARSELKRYVQRNLTLVKQGIRLAESPHYKGVDVETLVGEGVRKNGGVMENAKREFVVFSTLAHDYNKLHETIGSLTGNDPTALDSLLRNFVGDLKNLEAYALKSPERMQMKSEYSKNALKELSEYYDRRFNAKMTRETMSRKNYEDREAYYKACKSRGHNPDCHRTKDQYSKRFPNGPADVSKVSYKDLVDWVGNSKPNQSFEKFQESKKSPKKEKVKSKAPRSALKVKAKRSKKYVMPRSDSDIDYDKYTDTQFDSDAMGEWNSKRYNNWNYGGEGNVDWNKTTTKKGSPKRVATGSDADIDYNKYTDTQFDQDTMGEWNGKKYNNWNYGGGDNIDWNKTTTGEEEYDEMMQRPKAKKGSPKAKKGSPKAKKGSLYNDHFKDFQGSHTKF